MRPNTRTNSHELTRRRTDISGKTYGFDKMMDKILDSMMKKLAAIAEEGLQRRDLQLELGGSMPAKTKRLTREVNKVVIVRGEDQSITLPERMTHDEAIAWIKKIKEREETVVATHHAIDAFPTEGAIAFARALDEKFGFFQQVEQIKSGFFGPTTEPPKTVWIKTGVGMRKSVPWGRVNIPTVEGYIETGFALQGNRVVLSLSGKTPRKNEHLFDEVAELTQKFVNEASIYRGKAIDYCFKSPLDPDFNPFTDCPKFIDVSKINTTDLIFSKEVFDQIDTSLFTPIRAREIMKKMHIAFKRGVLLIGDYGVGKSLCALVTARMCEDAGITFLRVSPASRLAEAVEFARAYQPCVVFCEDIDRAVSGERDVDVDELLNTIDGIDSKNTDIMVVLTSNHLESIHEAMLRPGRLDAVVHVLPPDGDAVIRLIHLYARGRVSEREDLTTVGKLLNGLNPAIIREAVDRAQLASVRRSLANGGIFGPRDTKNLTSTDLEISARGLRMERDLVKASRKDIPTITEKFADRFGTVLGKTIGKHMALRDHTPVAEEAAE